MIKKIIITSAIFISNATIGFAASAPYLGVGVGLANNTSGNANYRGVPMTLAGGFGTTLNQNVYLAGELFAHLGTLTLNNNPGSVNLRTTYGYGASFVPGILLSDHAITFVRLGVVATRFSHLGKTVAGSQMGLGLQTGVTQNWDVRGEYDYTRYRKVSGVSPRADAFNVGLIYKFE